MAELDVDDFYKEFGRRVRLAREKANVTQAQLAKALGLTRSSVANLEAGRQKVLLHVLMIAADQFGVPPSTLLPEYEGPTPGLDLAKLDERVGKLKENDRDFVLKAVRVGMAGSVTDGTS